MSLMESDDSLPIDDYLSLPDLEDDIPNELSQELDDLSTIQLINNPWVPQLLEDPPSLASIPSLSSNIPTDRDTIMSNWLQTVPITLKIGLAVRMFPRTS